MTARGKPGKPKAGFPPFPPSLESPQKQRASHIPTATTTAPLYKKEDKQGRPSAEPKTVNSEGGPKQTAEVGQNQLPKPVRVSTTRQGEEGVSLQEQRRAIERYAAAAGFTICRWFEECRTAARR